MMTLLGMLMLYIAAIIVGKRAARMSKGIYLLLLLLAIVQTTLVMFDMYSRTLRNF